LYIFQKEKKEVCLIPRQWNVIMLDTVNLKKKVRAWDPVIRKVLISRDIVFQELDDCAVEIEKPNKIFDLVANSCFEEEIKLLQASQLDVFIRSNI
jgi:hypothetical protein